MKTYKTIPGDRASDFFIKSLTSGGIYGPVVDCDYCGRMHYCVDDNYAESEDNPEGTCITEEAARNILSCLENPDSVVFNREVDCIEYVMMHHIKFVVDCPCNGLRAYENFIWDNKDSIRKYLKTRIDQEFIWAEEQKTVNRLLGIG